MTPRDAHLAQLVERRREWLAYVAIEDREHEAAAMALINRLLDLLNAEDTPRPAKAHWP